MLRNRKHIRLHGFDYASKGSYFITICTKDRLNFLGEIENKKFEFSPIGAIAYTYWNQIPKHFSHVRLGEFVIMPNHIHGIIEIVDSVGTRHGVSQHGVSQHGVSQHGVSQHGVSQQNDVTNPTTNNNQNQFGKTIPGSISAVIGQFKSSVTRWCNKNDLIFAWQSRFYDNIIRNKTAFHRIEEYIKNNVANWDEDKFFNENV